MGLLGNGSILHNCWEIKGLSVLKRMNVVFKKHWMLVLGLGWILLWVLPWATWVHSNWLRLGIGMGMFIAPGMFISLLLVDKRLSLLGHFSSGVALSIFLIGSLGFLGRVFHYPFDFIKPVFALIGLGGILILDRRVRSGMQLYKPVNISIITFVLLIFILAVGVIKVLTEVRFSGDDLTYIAYVTNYQHAQPLNFEEPIFGLGELDRVRFWTAMFPMSLAFLSELSDIHAILLIGFYLAPFLVVFAFLANYVLYEDFFQSEYQAIAALMLQFSFLMMRSTIGQAFFLRLTEDKGFAAFVIAPVFFLAIRHFLDSFSWPVGAFVFLIGLGLSITHTIIFAYCIFIAGVYAGIYLLFVAKDFKKLLIVISLLVILVFPSSLLRFVDTPSSPQSFDLNSALEKGSVETRIDYIDGTPFYGFNLDRIRLQVTSSAIKGSLRNFMSLSYLWIAVGGFFWSIFNIKKSILAPFVAATSMLVLVCAIPYTGWLMGYLVTARMLWRAPWLLPGGMIGMILIVSLLDFLWQKMFVKFHPPIVGEHVAVSVLLMLSLILSNAPIKISIGKLDNFEETTINHRNSLIDLAALGNYLEGYVKQTSRFVSTPELMTRLPGLSSKSKTPFFRSAQYTSLISSTPVNTKTFAPVISNEASISIQDRTNLLEKYDIRYILTESTALKNYYSAYPESFHLQTFNDYWIIEFRQQGF